MTSRMTPLMLAIGALAGAVILPLASLSLDNEAGRPPVLTLPGADARTGLFPALWTAQWPGLAVVLGVILPLALVSIATYILVRRPCRDEPIDEP